MTSEQALTAALQPHKLKNASVSYPPGWRELVAQCTESLNRIYPDFMFTQIKEKFGGLRYYLVDTVPEEYFESVHQCVQRYEDRSYVTCQSCGRTGSLTTISGWYYTLCPEHTASTRAWRLKQWETVNPGTPAPEKFDVTYLHHGTEWRR